MSLSKRTISLVGPNFQQGPKRLNAFFLPYSVGILWSFAYQFEEIKNQYELDYLVWRREEIDNLADRLSNNFIVGFSLYVWNREYCYALAKEIKKINPNVIIIFGGPECPVTEKNVFKRLPFIDIFIKQEGEITFKKILDNPFDLQLIKGIVINQNGKELDTGDPIRIENLETIPSPYLTGVFDKIMKDNPDVQWNVTLETNRGCPFMCTFCDWGSLTYNKIKKFNLENVFGEIEWFGKHKIGFMTIADANFGVFYERDSMIVDKIIDTQNKYGYPEKYQMCWAKNQKREVVELVKKMVSRGNNHSGLNIALQSLNEDVLEEIKRTNMEINNIEEVMHLCEKYNLPIYTELILGLPKETLDTWRETYWKLFRMGNHYGITAYQSQLLENAEMNLLQKKLHKIESTKIYDYFSSSYTTDDPIKESIRIVTATKDLPKESMIDAMTFNWYINTFHLYPLSTFLSRFVYKMYNIDYEIFYMNLFDTLKKDKWVSNEIAEMQHYFKKWFKDGSLDHPLLYGIELNGSNLPYRTIIKIHAEDKIDHIYNILKKYMEQFDIEQSILSDLIELQTTYMIKYENIDQYPIIKTFNYNIYDYITSNSNLNNIPINYQFEFNEDKSMTKQIFLELQYFGRRRNFGRAIVRQAD